MCLTRLNATYVRRHFKKAESERRNARGGRWREEERVEREGRERGETGREAGGERNRKNARGGKQRYCRETEEEWEGRQEERDRVGRQAGEREEEHEGRKLEIEKRKARGSQW